jgi:NAD+ kinase
MNLAIFGKSVNGSSMCYLQSLIDRIDSPVNDLWIYEPFYASLGGQIRFSRTPSVFNKMDDISGIADLFFSIGGDGTILEAVTLVGETGIPVAGINMGHLGFLSTISKEEIVPAIDEIIKKKYFIDERTLLKLETTHDLFSDFNFALNDLTVYKSKALTMLTIKVWINGEFLNSYWADGLIVATPTGSTAYSLSCTGPIITPGSQNFVITPIASHNLTVRPIVVQDDSQIRIVVESVENEFFVSLDSRVERISTSVELNISKAGFRIRLLRMSNRNFFQTLREKLKWGLDIRN